MVRIVSMSQVGAAIRYDQMVTGWETGRTESEEREAKSRLSRKQIREQQSRVLAEIREEREKLKGSK